jgi:hypothetical protein
MLARGSRREQAPLNFGKVWSEPAVAARAVTCFNKQTKKNDAGGAFAAGRGRI